MGIRVKNWKTQFLHFLPMNDLHFVIKSHLGYSSFFSYIFWSIPPNLGHSLDHVTNIEVGPFWSLFYNFEDFDTPCLFLHSAYAVLGDQNISFGCHFNPRGVPNLVEVVG